MPARVFAWVTQRQVTDVYKRFVAHYTKARSLSYTLPTVPLSDTVRSSTVTLISLPASEALRATRISTRSSRAWVDGLLILGGHDCGI